MKISLVGYKLSQIYKDSIWTQFWIQIYQLFPHWNSLWCFRMSQVLALRKKSHKTILFNRCFSKKKTNLCCGSCVSLSVREGNRISVLFIWGPNKMSIFSHYLYYGWPKLIWLCSVLNRFWIGYSSQWQVF